MTGGNGGAAGSGTGLFADGSRGGNGGNVYVFGPGATAKPGNGGAAGAGSLIGGRPGQPGQNGTVTDTGAKTAGAGSARAPRRG